MVMRSMLLSAAINHPAYSRSARLPQREQGIDPSRWAGLANVGADRHHEARELSFIAQLSSACELTS